MELIGYYLLFAFSISISACYLWFMPLVKQAKQQGIKNSFTYYYKASIVVYILISAAVAPILLFPMLSHEMALRFEEGLRKEILKPEEDFQS